MGGRHYSPPTAYPSSGKAGGGAQNPVGLQVNVTGSRKMRTLTLTRQEAKALKTMGASVTACFSFVALFLGADVAYVLALVTQKTSFSSEHWVVVCVLGAGCLIFVISSVVLSARGNDLITEVERETETEGGT